MILSRLCAPKSLRSALLGVSLLVLFTLVNTDHTAQADQAIDKVKAVFLYNFFNYVQWPEDKQWDQDNNASLCMIGKHNLKELLENIAKRLAGKKSFKVRSVSWQELDQIEQCHILYISKSEERQAKANRDNIFKRGVLTVSDIPDYASTVGMIELYPKGNRIAVAMNLKLLNQAELKPSSKLARIAKIVEN